MRALVPATLLMACACRDASQPLTDDPGSPRILPVPTECAGVARVHSLPQEDIGALHAVITSPEADVAFGQYTSVPGDVNGDGCDDLIVKSLSAVHVFYGPLGGGVWSSDDADVVHPLTSGGLVTRAGDVDGDGRMDFWVGSKLFAVRDGSLEELASVQSGTFVAGGFDADGDGAFDALVASSVYGVTQLVYGDLPSLGESTLSPGNVPLDPGTAELTGPCGTDDYGVGQSMGDLDGDGVIDLMVGGCQSGASLFRGGDLRDTRLGAADAWATEPFFGLTENAGDVDGDGVDDIWDQAGIWSGASVGAGSPVLVVSAGDRILLPVGGDVDGDGRADFQVRAGTSLDTWLFGGDVTSLDSSVVPDLGTLLGTDGGAFGTAQVPVYNGLVAERAGDLTGDGGVDLIGAAPSVGVGGEIYVWSSADVVVNGR